MTQHLRSALRWVLIVGAAVWAVYVIAIQAVLWTPLFDRIVNSDPDSLDIHYRRGWSFFPGIVHARDLRIRSSDSNVEWLLALDEVTFDVSLWGLVHRRFDVKHARGRAITFHARQKLEFVPDPGAIAKLAPVPGFPPYSMRPAGPPGPERWSDAAWHLVTVQLEDVVADDVREVWIDGLRFVGDAKVTGGFRLKPMREVAVGPVQVEIHSGNVNEGESAPIATDLAGSANVRIAPFDPRNLHGREVLRFFTVDTDLRGKLDHPSVEMRRVALRIQDGRVASGTRIEAASPRVDVKRDAFEGSAGFDATAIVEGDVLSARANIERFELKKDGGAVARAGDIGVTFDAPAFDLVSASICDARASVNAAVTLGPLAGSARAAIAITHWDIDGGDVDFGSSRLLFDGEIADRFTLNALLPKGVNLEVGRPRVKADLPYPRGTGSVDVALTNGVVELKGVRVGGDFHAHTTLAWVGERALNLSGSRLSLRNVWFRKGDAHIENWQGDATFEDARVELEPKKFDGSLAVAATNAKPALELLDVPGIVAPLVEMPGLRGGARLHVAKDDVAVTNVDLHGGDVRVRGSSRDGFAVDKGPFSVTVGGRKAKR